MFTNTAPAVDPRWRDMYRIGAISFVIVNVLVVIAIVAFFIAPYAPREIPTVEILETLQTDLLSGLFSLDLLLLMTGFVMILPVLALYIALRHVNETWALIALVMGLMAMVLIIVARPVTELVYLSQQYEAATTDLARSQYLAAAEALIAIFDGTAWIGYTVFLAFSTVISGLLMLRTDRFSQAEGYVGIVVGATPLGFFIPGLGPLLLLIATFGGIVWYTMLARTFYRLGWQTG